MRFLSLVAIFHVICNNDDRRQRRIEGGVVGAAASKDANRVKQTLGAATRLLASGARLRG